MGQGNSLSVIGANTFRGEISGLRYHAIDAQAKVTSEGTQSDTFPVINLYLIPVSTNRINVKIRFSNSAIKAYVLDMLEEIAYLWPETNNQINQEKLIKAESQGGNPGLSKSELIYRLAKAIEAEEIKAKNPEKT